MFWAAELNFRGALGYLRGFNQVDNQMGGLYHWFQGQKCSRPAHLELIWEIPVNVTGGLKIREPAADLGIALSIASSFRDVGVDPQLVVVGEVGLSGELRAVSQLDRRVAEAARLGFKRCLVPKVSAKISPAPKNIELIPVSTLREAIGVGLVGGKAKEEI